MSRQRGKADLDGVVIVEDEIDPPHEIEGDYEQPKEWTYPYREKRKDRQHPGCQVSVGGERGKARGQIADDTWKNKDEPEEAEAGYGTEGTFCCNQVLRFHTGQ